VIKKDMVELDGTKYSGKEFYGHHMKRDPIAGTLSIDAW